MLDLKYYIIVYVGVKMIIYVVKIKGKRYGWYIKCDDICKMQRIIKLMCRIKNRYRFEANLHYVGGVGSVSELRDYDNFFKAHKPVNIIQFVRLVK